MNENKLNVYQRLLEVRKSVSYLKKDADNKGQGFKFVSSSQTLAAVREEMNNQGLMLIPSVEDFEVRDHKTSSGAGWYFTILRMELTWVNVDNPEDKFTCKWTGQGLDQGEKGVGKSLTYAEKYFILKTFNIPTDKDDPDAFEEKHSGKKNGTTTTKKTTTKTSDPPTDDDTAKKLDFIAKIMANASKATQLQCPADATPEDKNKTCSEILVQWSSYEFKDEKTGKMVQCKTATGREDLKKFKVSRLQVIYGNSKKSISNLEAVVDPPPVTSSGDGQEGLPF